MAKEEYQFLLTKRCVTLGEYFCPGQSQETEDHMYVYSMDMYVGMYVCNSVCRLHLYMYKNVYARMYKGWRHFGCIASGWIGTGNWEEGRLLL